MAKKLIATCTTTKEALKEWKKRTNQEPVLATHVNLEYQNPPIIRIGPPIRKLRNCRVLSLACNMIEKPIMPSTLTNLRVLNLSRNNLSTLSGIQILGPTLEELWVSYNLITKLSPIEGMKVLKTFYVSHNNIKDWVEMKSLLQLPALREISFSGNPLQQSCGEERFRRELVKRLPKLRKIDFMPVFKNESLSIV